MIKYITFAMALIASPVGAAQTCFPRDNLMMKLADNYGERQQFIGLISSGNVMEIFVNEETETWTMIITGADGLSCITIVGDAFTDVETARKPNL